MPTVPAREGQKARGAIRFDGATRGRECDREILFEEGFSSLLKYVLICVEHPGCVRAKSTWKEYSNPGKIQSVKELNYLQ